MKDLIGIEPKLRNILDSIGSSVAGGAITMTITPATVAPKPTAAAWTRKVAITFKDVYGNVCEWMNGITVSAAIGDTSTAGTATIDSATPTVYNGVAVVTVSGDAASWLNSETDTVTISNKTILGATVTGGTSVQTFTT